MFTTRLAPKLAITFVPQASTPQTNTPAEKLGTELWTFRRLGVGWARALCAMDCFSTVLTNATLSFQKFLSQHGLLMLRSLITIILTLALNVAIIVVLGLLLFSTDKLFGPTGTTVLNIGLASTAAGAFVVLRVRQARAVAAERAKHGVPGHWFEFASPLTLTILLVTTSISVIAWEPWRHAPGGEVLAALSLDPAAVYRGELWRLLSSSAVHANIVHLLMNLAGLALVDLVLNGEQMLGKRRMAAVYIGGAVIAAGASLAFTGKASVGASGALMALLAALYFAHRDKATSAERWLVEASEQASALALAALRSASAAARKRAGIAYEVIMLTLVFGLSAAILAGLPIDNAAHSGGVLGGAALYLLTRRRRGKA